MSESDQTNSQDSSGANRGDNGQGGGQDSSGASVQDSGQSNPARPDSVLDGDIYFTIPLWSSAVLAALYCALLIWRFGFDIVLVSLIPFAIVTSILTVIDLRELRLPDVWTRPSTAILPVLLAIAAQSQRWPDVSFKRALIAGGLTFVGYFVIWLAAALLIGVHAFGFGDVKLAPILGAQLGFFGYETLIRGLLLTHVLAGVVSVIVVLVLKFARRKDAFKAGIPLGPSMVLGAILALLWYTW